MDGDGVRDYVSGHRRVTPYPNTVEVFSGKDDSVIRSIKGRFGDWFGREALGDVDVDGDKKPDLIVTAPLENQPIGAIYVFSNSGRLAYKIPQRCWRLGRIGDFDRDGCDDFLAGCQAGLQGAGHVNLFSGRTGKLLKQVVGTSQRQGFGWGALEGCGDIDADGVLDFVVSNDPLFTSTFVRVYSGKTGKSLYSWQPKSGPPFAVGDLDRDGVMDLLIGSSKEKVVSKLFNATSGGSILWVSLRDGSVVTRLFPAGLPWYTTGLGASVVIGRPQPGNPFPVFLTTEYRYGPYSNSPPFQGRLTLYRAAPKGVRSLGAPCVGTLKTAPRIGLSDLGNKGVRLHLTDTRPQAFAALLAGLSRTRWDNIPLPLKLHALGFTGCRLHTSVELIQVRRTGTSRNEIGYAFIDFPLPLATTNARFTMSGQWLVLGTGPNTPGGVTSALSWMH